MNTLCGRRVCLPVSDVSASELLRQVLCFVTGDLGKIVMQFEFKHFDPQIKTGLREAVN
jgi:hypothetical protein